MNAVAAIARERKRGAGKNADAVLGILLVTPIVVVMAALVFFPLADTFWDSLHRVNPMQPGTPFIGLANYTNMLADSDVNTAWYNTFLYVVIAVTVETLVGIAGAALINQVKVGRQWLLAAVILPWALPGVVNATIWLWIYQPGAGLLNGILTAFGLPFDNHVWFNDKASAIIAVVTVHIWRMLPLTIVIVLAAMQSIPGELYEAARIDGANRGSMFSSITLPLVRGAIAIAMTNSTVAAFNFFDEAWVLSGSSLDTRPILVQIYLEAFQNLHFSYGMAISLVVTLVSLLVSLLYVVRVYRRSEARTMRQSLAFRLMIWLGVAVLLVWSLGPIYWTLASAVTPTADFSNRPIHFVPIHFTLDHFERLLGINVSQIGGVEVWAQFRAALFNSIVASLAATIVCVVIAALGGYAFTRLNFPGRRVVFFAVVATLAIPGYAVLIPLYRLMTGLHLVDTFLGVTLIYVSAFLPLSLWLLRSVFESLPISIEEAAQLDGASRLYILFRIVMPLAAPGLTAAAILTFLGAWGAYAVPLIFSPTKTKPLTVLIPEFATKNFIDYGLITAAGSIAIIVPALVVIFLNRYLISGLLAGSAK